MGESMTAAVPSEGVERARIGVYRFLLSALDRPTPEQHEWMRGPEFRHSLEGLCETFGVDCRDGELVPDEFADHECRYLACFEVGLPAPPVPLLASHYNRREPAPHVIHEHILLYRLFGVQVRATRPEPAGHLVDQLAFLIHLDELSLAGDVERASLLRARHDFLRRHVLRWVPRAADGAAENHLPPVYRTLLALLVRAVEQDDELTALASESA
jgi:TorA maturation chaperone TorD